MTLDLDIHEDVRQASTPSSELYTSEAVHGHLMQNAFGRSWQFLSSAMHLGEQKGAQQPFTLFPTSLKEPLVLTRDGDGDMHCLSNVCTHRGQILVRDPVDKAASIRCCYHGRRFDLDGKFKSMPKFDEALDFPREGGLDDLPKLEIGSLGPALRFTSLDPALGFDEWIKPVRDLVDFMPLDEAVWDPASERSFDLDANWCLYVENFLEWLHLPFIHRKTLTPAIDLKSYSAELMDHGITLQLGTAKKKNEVIFDLPPSHPFADQRVSAMWFHLPPNLMLNFYPWGVSVNVVEPLTVKTCRVHYHQFVWREELRDMFDLMEIELEDQDAVQHQQAGVSSKLYTRGRYSPSQEYAMHHFHRHLHTMLRPPE